MNEPKCEVSSKEVDLLACSTKKTKDQEVMGNLSDELMKNKEEGRCKVKTERKMDDKNRMSYRDRLVKENRAYDDESEQEEFMYDYQWNRSKRKSNAIRGTRSIVSYHSNVCC